jgi:flagellin-like protein
MKQIINKEDKAVSPIIATILLIAITVVLAATLYTVLGGFTSGLSTSGSATLSGTFANTTSSTNGYNYSFSISSSSSGGISISSLELKIVNNTGTFTTSALSSGSNHIGNYTINVTGLSGGKVVAGTTITISTLIGNNNSTVPIRNFAISKISIIDTSSNSVIYTS